MDVGTETDGQLQEAQAALEAQRSQAKALKRRILELQVNPTQNALLLQADCIPVRTSLLAVEAVFMQCL